MRLKPLEVKEYRLKVLKEQRGVCPMCLTNIQSGQDTLDHDHNTGHVRRVLCRNCNQIEGRVLNWVKKAYCTPEVFLANLALYWSEDYSRNVYHPNHKSDIEKQVTKLRRRMRKLKTERKRQEYKDKIKALQEKDK